MRQIVLDTETTGLETGQDHRIIEIGCVELSHRRLTGNDLHLYIQPDRQIDEQAMRVHGITQAFLADKPRFDEIAATLTDYLGDAQLIIHNAPFDLGFLDHEYTRLDSGHQPWAQRLEVIDTLAWARERYPGQRNKLDALCRRFEIDNSGRDLHGALLDSQLLADVYLAMTGGQIDIALAADQQPGADNQTGVDLAQRLATADRRPRVVPAGAEEKTAHERYLDLLAKASGDRCLWRALDGPASDPG